MDAASPDSSLLLLAAPTALSEREHPRGWQIGNAVVLRKFDYSEEMGHTKFFLHKVKPGVWYRIRSVDEIEQRVLVTSQVGYEFSFRPDISVINNYVAALFPEGTKEPTPEVLAFINRQLSSLQISAHKEGGTPE